MTDEQTSLELCNEYGPRKPGMAAAIVRALQQAREEGKRSAFDSTNPPDPKPLVWLNGKKVAPAGHIIDDQGVVRRVLGTLPVTADGCVIGDVCRIWYDGEYIASQPCRSSLAGESGWHQFWCESTWSTREAAEAAKEAK